MRLRVFVSLHRSMTACGNEIPPGDAVLGCCESSTFTAVESVLGFDLQSVWRPASSALPGAIRLNQPQTCIANASRKPDFAWAPLTRYWPD
jgi:hypothetical protein